MMLTPWWLKLAGAAALAAALVGSGWVVGRDQERLSWIERVQSEELARQEVVNRQNANQARLARSRDESNRRTADMLLRTIDSLRNRPDRPVEVPGAADHSCKGATGAELYREDAGFLAREAARAERLRDALAECFATLDDAERIRREAGKQ